MKIVSVTVSYSRTHSLPDYCNVKPGLSVIIEPDASTLDLGTEIQALDKRITEHVHGKIDDELERAGQSPVFYEGDLYRLWHWQQRQCDVILAHGVRIRGLGDWEPITYHGMRLETVWALAEKRYVYINMDKALGPLDDDTPLREWWEQHRMYAIYVLSLSGKPYRPDPGADALWIIPEDLRRPIELVHPTGPRDLIDNLIPRVRDEQDKYVRLAWGGRSLTLDTQKALDDHVSAWLDDIEREALDQGHTVYSEDEQDEDNPWPDDRFDESFVEEDEIQF